MATTTAAGDDLVVDPALQVGGVQEDVGELDVVEAPVRKAPSSASSSAQIRLTSDLEIPLIDAQRRDQVVDLAGRDPVHVGLHDHGEQGPVDPAAALEERGEERLPRGASGSSARGRRPWSRAAVNGARCAGSPGSSVRS